MYRTAFSLLLLGIAFFCPSPGNASSAAFSSSEPGADETMHAGTSRQSGTEKSQYPLIIYPEVSVPPYGSSGRPQPPFFVPPAGNPGTSLPIYPWGSGQGLNQPGQGFWPQTPPPPPSPGQTTPPALSVPGMIPATPPLPGAPPPFSPPASNGAPTWPTAPSPPGSPLPPQNNPSLFPSGNGGISGWPPSAPPAFAPPPQPR